MSLLGASAAARPRGQRALPGKVNDLRGNDRSKWQTDIPTPTGVSPIGRSTPAWTSPGLETRVGSSTTSSFAGADPAAIALGFEGVKRVRLDRSGELVLATRGGKLRQDAPVA